MLARRDDGESLDRLADELRLAPKLTQTLFSRVVTDACTRVFTLRQAGRTVPIDHLIEAQAWTDAALSLIEFELPMWRPRRLIYDSGEWLCSLSRHCDMPIEFDDTADGRHELRPLAMLISLVEAKRTLTATELAYRTSVPQVRPTATYPVCCDNFR